MTQGNEIHLRTFIAYSLLVGVVVFAGRSADTAIRGALAGRPAAQAASVAAYVPQDALKAQAAVIYDPTTGEFLYAKNEEMQLPLASITKLMTAAAILSKNDPAARVHLGDDVWTTEQLLKLGLVASSNDAIAAAAAATNSDIVAAMNNEAKRLGLAQTYFLDPTGLDLTRTTAGAYGSARDVAVLAAAFLKAYPELFEITARDSITLTSQDRAVTADSTSRPIHDIRGLIGAKTGYTRLAGGNLVAAFDLDIGHPLIAVVLNSTEDGRFDDMRALIQGVREAAGDRR